MNLLGIYVHSGPVQVFHCGVLDTLEGSEDNFMEVMVSILKVIFELISSFIWCLFSPPNIYIVIQDSCVG